MTDAYQDFLQRLFAQNEFSIRYDLDAMGEAMRLLQLARPARCVVLVGGTNGKGTTCSFLHAMARAAGLRVGLYTSPHLVDFRERVRINGAPLSPEQCVAVGLPLFDTFSGRDRPAATSRPLTYFELTTLLALQAFSGSALDLLILEVGLGGRLDATNAVEHDIAVVTSVQLDHQQYLGNTIAEIAVEKIAIARSNAPLVVHAAADGITELRSLAPATGAQLVEAVGGQTAREHNAAIASVVFGLVADRLGLADAVVAHGTHAGIANAVWPGRQDARVFQGQTWLCDGAHNPAAIAETVPWLRGMLARAGQAQLPLIVAASPGRDLTETFGPLIPLASSVVAVPATTNRTVDPRDLAAVFAAAGVPTSVAASTRDALAGRHEPLVGVVGSLYLVGAALAWMGVSAEDLLLERATTPTPTQAATY